MILIGRCLSTIGEMESRPDEDLLGRDLKILLSRGKFVKIILPSTCKGLIEEFIEEKSVIVSPVATLLWNPDIREATLESTLIWCLEPILVNLGAFILSKNAPMALRI